MRSRYQFQKNCLAPFVFTGGAVKKIQPFLRRKCLTFITFQTMRSCIIFFSLLAAVTLACSDNTPDPRNEALQRATTACDASFKQMAWLDSLLIQAESTKTMSAHGDVYMVPTSQGTLFVHQPVVMSCLGCFVYSCAGDRLELSQPVIMDEVIPGMQEKNLLYRSTL
jgi:hypothetical protein